MEYQRTPREFAPFLQSAGLQAACVWAANRGANWVRDRAPRDQGDYARGVRAVPARSPRGDRVGARLEATDPKSAAIEFGNRRVKGRHLLRDAIPIIQGGRR